MKTLDVLGTGAKKAVQAVAGAASAIAGRVAGKPGRPLSRDAEEELRRRAEINAAGEQRRADREAALFGGSRFMPRRPGWIDRRR